MNEQKLYASLRACAREIERSEALWRRVAQRAGAAGLRAELAAGVAANERQAAAVRALAMRAFGGRAA